jgi:hypothetical protein
VAERYTLTAREGARVRRRRHRELSDALADLEREGRGLEAGAGEHAVGGTLIRKLEPVQIVVARLELSGPRGLRAGVDVRGDGSSEAFLGRVRRRLIEQQGRETPFDALRRVLA